MIVDKQKYLSLYLSKICVRIQLRYLGRSPLSLSFAFIRFYRCFIAVIIAITMPTIFTIISTLSFKGSSLNSLHISFFLLSSVFLFVTSVLYDFFRTLSTIKYDFFHIFFFFYIAKYDFFRYTKEKEEIVYGKK